jgi:membrane protein implicated in regulation of membrane protease activity
MSKDGTAEAIATTGLFLIISAVIALVVALGNWSAANATTATLAGAFAVFCFAGSLTCFRAQAKEDDREVLAS